ncbi:hypothetical protein [Halorhabdus amylolytica]|uniref:hypothetical protein n=1 Tax=Halorhabdus amylolytica TaxID=2559573 RepID=UPI0010AA368D|nr:hypothetical protein [Halorhabdus amylolytica]
MGFRDDDRAQAIQIGAVLLFAVLVIAFSLYQAFVVPNQNAQVERNHLQTLEGQMQDLRDGIVNVPKTGTGRSVHLALGTNYPARAITLNPPPASGQLRTVGTADPGVNFTIANARALDDETADYWNGTNRTRETGQIVYAPDYNEFQDPPDLVYDTTTVFSRFDDASLWTTGQTLVDGRQVTLVAIDGSYDRGSSRSVSVDLDAVSASTTEIGVTNTSDGNVTIAFTSQRAPAEWRSLLEDEQQLDHPNGYVHDVSGEPLSEEYWRISIAMEAGETYRLRMAKVGIGTDVEDTTATYLRTVAGNGTTVPEGGKASITVEARDAFNNPVPARIVAGTARNDSAVSPRSRSVGTDGRVTLTYEALGDVVNESQVSDRVRVSLDPALSGMVNDNGSDFDGSTPENVSLVVRADNSDRSGLAGGNANMVTYDGDGSAAGPGGTGVSFNVTNEGSSGVTIAQIAIESGSSAVKVFEGDGGSGRWNREVFVDATTDGYVESGEQNYNQAGYVLGSGSTSFDQIPKIAAGDTAGFYIYEFRNGNGANADVDMNGESVTVTLTFGDGSTKEISFTG